MLGEPSLLSLSYGVGGSRTIAHSRSRYMCENNGSVVEGKLSPGDCCRHRSLGRLAFCIKGMHRGLAWVSPFSFSHFPLALFGTARLAR